MYSKALPLAWERLSPIDWSCILSLTEATYIHVPISFSLLPSHVFTAPHSSRSGALRQDGAFYPCNGHFLRPTTAKAPFSTQNKSENLRGVNWGARWSFSPCSSTLATFNPRPPVRIATSSPLRSHTYFCMYVLIRVLCVLYPVTILSPSLFTYLPEYRHCYKSISGRGGCRRAPN